MAETDDYDRLRRTPRVIFDGHETVGVWRRPPWLVTRPTEQQIGHFRVIPDNEGRPDQIADALYGTPSLWWVIVAFNWPASAAALNWPAAGDIIEYPAESLVIPEL